MTILPMNEHFGNRKNLYTPFAFKLAWSCLLYLAILIKPHFTYDRENDLQITYQRKDLLYYEKYKENGYCGLACCIYLHCNYDY